jgi:uncharacterized protein YggE
MKHRRSQAALAAALAILTGSVLAGCGAKDTITVAAAKPSRSVSATATGTATGVPDQLVADVGISNEGASAADVLAENNMKTKALLDALDDAGIDPKDVATTSVQLGPRYGDNGEITGYQATNTVRVTLRDLDTAGAQLDDLVKVGGDSARIQSVSLGFNEDDALLTEARLDGVARAKKQAEEMAKAAGAELGDVRTIADVDTSMPSPLAYAGAEAASDSSVPISAGSQDLTVQVRVVYELR